MENKNNFVVLNRMFISGPLIDDTPRCVIFQIAKSFSISVNDKEKNVLYDQLVIDEIRRRNNIIIDYNNFNNYISQIAQYVNPDINWDIENLKIAFDHLQEYQIIAIPNNPSKNFQFGSKTNSNPLSYDACMLYRICKYNNIETNRLTSEEQMAHMISLLNENVTKIKNIHIENKTNEDVIILSAIIYNINLSECSDPYKEYLELKIYKDKYIPVYDKIFKIRYIINPLWYNVKKTFTSSLSFLYKSSQINKLAKIEGYKSGSSLEFLELSRTKPNFYLGIHPYLIDENFEELKTSINEENAYEQRSYIISYGIVNSKSFELFTVDDLLMTFKVHNKLVIPTKPKELLTNENVIKLKNICLEFINLNKNSFDDSIKDAISAITSLNNISNGLPKVIIDIATLVKNSKETNQIINKYKELLFEIDFIEKFQSTMSIYALNIEHLYKNGDRETKEIINNYLTFILNIGLYMRGWKVEKSSNIDINVLPIKSNETITLISKYNEIENNVTNAINEAESILYNHPIEILKDLPLMQLMNNKFIPVSKIEEGIRIIDRINICKEGTSVHSCIRTSSNYFLISSYYYMLCCNIKPIFNIEDMDFIY
jgi:hypothetical protein